MGLLDLIGHKYPFTDFHELNLDWCITAVLQLQKAFEDFSAGNKLVYADPLQHDLTKTYAKNTIVIGANGDAYISLQPVTQGIPLTDTDYWLKVFDFSDYSEKANKNFTDNYFENVDRSPVALNIGDWLVLDDVLYKVITAIAADDLFIIGTNIIHFTVEQFLKDFVTSVTQTLNDYSITIQQYKNDIDASELQYKNDIDASELAYRNQLAQDIADTTASLQAQLDAAISGATVDSEVINARVGWDNRQFSTLGEAIRTQTGDICKLLDVSYLFSITEAYTSGVNFIHTYTLPVHIANGEHVHIKVKAPAGTIGLISCTVNTTELEFGSLTNGEYVWDYVATEEITSIKLVSGAVYVTGPGTLTMIITSPYAISEQLTAYDKMIYACGSKSATSGSSFSITLVPYPTIAAGKKFMIKCTAPSNVITNLGININGVLQGLISLVNGDNYFVYEATATVTSIQLSSAATYVVGSGTIDVKVLLLDDLDFELLSDIYVPEHNGYCYTLPYLSKIAFDVEGDTVKLRSGTNALSTADNIIIKKDMFIDGVISVDLSAVAHQSAVSYCGIIFDVTDAKNFKLFYVNHYGTGVYGYTVVDGVLTTQLFASHDYDSELTDDVNLAIEKDGNYYRFYCNNHLVDSRVIQAEYTGYYGLLIHTPAWSGFEFFNIAKQVKKYNKINYPIKDVHGFGDSIMYGQLASDADHRWFNILTDKIQEFYPDATFTNYAVGGYTVRQTMDNEILPNLSRDKQLAFIVCGTNDARDDRDTDPDVFKADYLEVIRGLKNYGIIPVAFTCLPCLLTTTEPPYSADTNPRIIKFNSIIRELCAKEDIMCVDLAFAFGVNPAPYMASDGIHPNDAGNALIYQTVYNKIFK